VKRKPFILLSFGLVLTLLCGFAVPVGAEIKVGMGNVLSGPVAGWGLDAQAGLEMAIEEINAAGGLLGEKVVLLARDDALDTTKAALQAEELIYKENVLAYFASTITGSAKATLPVAVKAKTPAILAAQQSDITCPWQCVGKEKGCCDPWVFRLSGTVSRQAEAMVLMARDKLKGKAIALMHDNIGYGLEWKKDLTAAAKKHGINFVASEMFPLMEIDHTAALTRVNEAGADVIVVGTLGAAAGRIYNTMKKLGMKQPLLLCEATLELAFRQTAENMGDGAYVASIQSQPYDTKDAKFKAFAKKWSQKYANLGYSDVLLTTPHGFNYYDAMKFFAAAVKKAGSKDKEKIREAMDNLGPFKSISGIEYLITPEKHGGVSNLPVRMWRFQDGKVLPAE
jgi:branched-chain amino acid transport system substrate-binding protein